MATLYLDHGSINEIIDSLLHIVATEKGIVLQTNHETDKEKTQ